MPTFKDQRAFLLYKTLTNGSVLVPPSKSENEIGEIVLNISQGRNLGCSYCFADQGKYGSGKTEFMSFDQAKTAIDKFLQSHKNIKTIKFFGGEPLLHFHLIKDVCSYFDYLFDIGKISEKPTFTLITNLTILNEDIVNHIAKYDFTITVSLDGPEHINDSFRKYYQGTGSFKIVDRNIKVLKNIIGNKLKIEAVFSPEHILSNMSMVDLYDFFFERYGLSNLVIHPLVENDYYKIIFSSYSKDVVEQYYNNMYIFSRDYGKRLVEKVIEGAEVRSVFFYLSQMSSKTQTDNHCGLGVNTITVNSDGIVYPCYTFINNKSFEMGNIEDAGQFSRKSNKFNNVQLTFLNNTKSSNPICSKCDIVDTCKACPGMMYSRSQILNDPIPLQCEYYVGLKEGILIGVLEASTKSTEWKKLIDSISASANLYSKACD
jgi:uncharacterized protein